MTPISVLIKPASGQCDMHCDYCFYCDEAVKRQRASYGFMSEETLKNVIRKCVIPAEGSCTIAFQGGEPTLCGLSFFQKSVEFSRHFNRKGIQINFALQTNGWGITEDWCRFFAEQHFLVGVSVDGTPWIHDRYRHGPGRTPTYARVVEATRMLEQNHVEYNILTVVTRDVAENIREIYQSYQDKGWNYLQFITCLDPLGELRGQRPYALLPERYGQFLIDLFDLWYTDYRRGRAPFIRQFENYIGILLGGVPESCEQRGRCGIQYVVEADGSVYPCDFYVLDQWKLGDLNVHRIAEIDARRRSLGFCARSRNHPAECASCTWRALCRGGCYRSRSTGREGPAGLNYFCQGYKMFLEYAQERLEKIAEELNAEMAPRRILRHDQGQSFSGPRRL